MCFITVNNKFRTFSLQAPRLKATWYFTDLPPNRSFFETNSIRPCAVDFFDREADIPPPYSSAKPQDDVNEMPPSYEASTVRSGIFWLFNIIPFFIVLAVLHRGEQQKLLMHLWLGKPGFYKVHSSRIRRRMFAAIIDCLHYRIWFTF